MSFAHSYLLLPCHSLEDFPTYHEGDEADGLLASWTVLWHPRLLAETGRLPQWLRADDPPESVADSLVVIPEISREQLPTGFLDRASTEAQCLIVGETDRDAILEKLVAAAEWDEERDTTWTADFFALSYCYLQIELLTRQMRYTSNLDEVHFAKQTVSAAEAVLAGDDETVERLLQSAFDLLAQERDHYYAVDAFLVDLTLLADTTLGHRLNLEVTQQEAPINLLLHAGLLRRLAEHHPENLQHIASRWRAEELGILGGDPVPFPWPWMGAESVIEELLRGRKLFVERLGAAPRVYGRFRSGLTNVLPMFLHKLGFVGALHATFDAGKTPAGSQAKMQWQAPDGSSVDAIARGILDATRPETFLSLAPKLGEAMDMEHVATLTFAHWPGRASRWYDDLRRIHRYGQPLGKFVTVESYFGESAYPGHLETLRSDEYRAPYLRDAIASHRLSTISRLVDYSASVSRLTAWSALASMRAAWQQADFDSRRYQGWLSEADSLIEDHDVSPVAESLMSALRELAEEFVRPLAAGDATPGYWVLNPTSHVRRTLVRLPPHTPTPPLEPPVYAAAKGPDETTVVVDVPAMGFVWLAAEGSADVAESKRRRRREPPLAEEWLLRNEFFEAVIQETTGSLQAIHCYGSRGNRLSMQLALRYGPGHHRDSPGADYSVMVADQCEVVRASTVLGEIATRGRLVDQHGELLARYQQTFRVSRGSRLLDVDIELDRVHEPSGDPWQSYYCARFAWGDESWLLYRCVNDVRQSTDAKRIECPRYLELNGVEERTTIFPHGLPFHRRVGFRMLDSVLTVPGEERATYRFSIGIDSRQPWQQAEWSNLPPLVVPTDRAPVGGRTAGWLFHIGAKHVSATHWEPLIKDGATRGVRVRLLETAGRAAAVAVRCPYDLDAARQTGWDGHVLAECKVAGDAATVELAAHELVQVELFWNGGDDTPAAGAHGETDDDHHD